MPIQKSTSALFRVVAGVTLLPALQVATKLDIAGLLKDSVLSVADLAERTQTHPDALYRLMRFLAAEGIFTEVRNSQEHFFANNEVSHLLRKDVPHSMNRYIAREIYTEWVNKALQHLSHSIHTGEPALDHAYGFSIWDYLQKNPTVRQDFDETMTILSEIFPGCTLAEYDFAQMDTIADIGGSYGSLLLEILHANPNSKGILFDRPEVIAKAKTIFQSVDKHITQRCQLQEGNFFDFVPNNCDIYLLRYILHNWGDDACIQILKNCRFASPSAKILIIEQVLEPEYPEIYTIIMDFWMLLSFRNAKERTRQEYAELLQAAGYSLTQVIPTESPLSIIEGIPSNF
jgi:O-methyltransferase domain